MEDVTVVVIFAACVCLLLFAYLATTVRCSLWCRKGMKTDFSQPKNDDLTFSTVTILSANGLSVDDLKPAEPTTPEVVIVTPKDVQSEQLYIVSIDISQDNVCDCSS
jgi:hypothetical protein|uniref:Uncharacterized protein n=1 Tax=Daphnia galeata TaxID=27404 RepID=A0A8J2W9L6_9CRUS|nr:unnamed protein product [Daphnia galeata]